MAVKLQLKATVVRALGDGALDDTISSESYQKTIAGAATLRSADNEPEVGDVIGQYRLVSRLGEGMFGSVYVAERTDVPEHRVALKLINRAVFGDRDPERELVMLAAATHPNIVELKDHGVTDDHIWLTMALYEGETLDERLERGALELEEAHRIFVPIAHGVAALHARGLRHQDIKPENIYLANFADQLHPVLLDLGVAVEATSDFIAGTALFGAPEQLAALGGLGEEAELSEKMDTYCLASTLLYSLVGEEHFPGQQARTPFHIVEAFDTRQDAPLADEALAELDGEPRRMLAEAFGRWLVKDPDERPTMAAMAEELDVLLEKKRAEARAETERVERQRTTLRWVQLLLAAIAVAGLALSYYGFTKRRTIALAGELERARAEGAASFDKLDTCQAAQNLTERREKQCLAGRKADGEAHAAALSTLQTEGEEAGKQLTTVQGLLKGCEDDSKTAADTCTADKESLTMAHDETKARCQERETALEGERDQCKSQMTSLEEGKKTCEAQLSTCRAAAAEPADPYEPGPPADKGPVAPPPSGPPPIPMDL